MKATQKPKNSFIKDEEIDKFVIENLRRRLAATKCSAFSPVGINAKRSNRSPKMQEKIIDLLKLNSIEINNAITSKKLKLQDVKDKN